MSTLRLELSRVFVYGDEYTFRLIAEFSLTEMKVEVYDKDARHVLSTDQLTALESFSIAGQGWRKIWQRHESDERGGYTAVALQQMKL